MLNNIVTLKSWLEVTQDHSKWYNSKVWVRFPIHVPSVSIYTTSALSAMSAGNQCGRHRVYSSITHHGSAQFLLRWWGFFPASGVSGTVIEPSVDVDDGGAGSVKQARLALCLVLLRLSSLRYLSRYFRIIVSYLYRDNSCACGTIYLRGTCAMQAWSIHHQSTQVSARFSHVPRTTWRVWLPPVAD